MKLSEFEGQEHITSVLRAMVIKDNVSPFLSFEGDEELSRQLVTAFVRALNCPNAERGDACDNCDACNSVMSNVLWTNGLNAGSAWGAYLVSERPTLRQPRSIYVAFSHIDGFMSFQIKKPAGALVDPACLRLFINAFYGKMDMVLKQSEELSTLVTCSTFLNNMLELNKALIYIQNNLEVAETGQIEILRKLAVAITPYRVTACMRLLWEAQAPSVLSDALRIQTLSALLTETLHPTPAPSYEVVTSGESDTPIMVIDNQTGQSLSLDRIMEIAQE